MKTFYKLSCESISCRPSLLSKQKLKIKKNKIITNY